MFCGNCGRQIEKGIKYCPNCGAGVASEANQRKRSVSVGVKSLQGDSGVLQGEATKSKKWLVVIVAVVLIFVLRKYFSDNFSEDGMESFRNGVAKGYGKSKFMMDTDQVINYYHNLGYEYVWLISHEIRVPDGKKIGDGGTYDDIYLKASVVDEDNYYYITQAVNAVWSYLGENLGGWTERPLSYGVKDEMEYDLSGFNNTYWKITDAKTASILAYNMMHIQEAKDIEDIEVYLAFFGFEKLNYKRPSSFDNSWSDWTFWCDHSVAKAVAIVDGEVYNGNLYLNNREWNGVTVYREVGGSYVHFRFTDGVADRGIHDYVLVYYRAGDNASYIKAVSKGEFDRIAGGK